MWPRPCYVRPFHPARSRSHCLPHDIGGLSNSLISWCWLLAGQFLCLGGATFASFPSRQPAWFCSASCSIFRDSLVLHKREPHHLNLKEYPSWQPALAFLPILYSLGFLGLLEGLSPPCAVRRSFFAPQREILTVCTLVSGSQYPYRELAVV